MRSQRCAFAQQPNLSSDEMMMVPGILSTRLRERGYVCVVLLSALDDFSVWVSLARALSESTFL